MPISLVCAGCKKKLKVPDTAAGKKFRCPVCQAPNVAPKNEEPPPDDDDLVEPDEDEEDEKPKKETRVTSSSPKGSPKKKKADDDDLVEPDEDEDESDKETGYTASEPKPKPKKRSKARDDDDEDDEDEEVEVERDEPRRRRKKKKKKRYGDFHGDLNERRKDDHRGIAILLTGIGAIFVAFICPLLCWILAIVAINMANDDRARMERGKMDDAGQGMTTAGMVCAYVAVVLGVINCCCGASFRMGAFGDFG